MARGWESKSIEAQIDAAQVPRNLVPRRQQSPESIELMRKKENILLSRTRVVRELQTSQNPRYRAVLSKALADLDVQLSAFVAD